MSRNSLCVLAGGESRRFGSPKTDVAINDVPSCAWIADRLRSSASFTVLNVASDGPIIRGVDAFDRVILDRHRYAGPLAGMQTVVDSLETRLPNLSNVRSDDIDDDDFIIFATADMPLVTVDRIDQLVDVVRRNTELIGIMNRWVDEPALETTAPTPTHSSATRRSVDIEPFPSVWRVGLARSLFARALAEGVRGPYRLAGFPNVTTLPISAAESAAFTNVNTREDLNALAQNHPDLKVCVSPAAPRSHPE